MLLPPHVHQGGHGGAQTANSRRCSSCRPLAGYIWRSSRHCRCPGSRTELHIKEFLVSIRPRLHTQLLEYENDKPFIEDLWYETFLNHRSSAVLNANEFFGLEDDTTPQPALVAVLLKMSVLKFAKALRTRYEQACSIPTYGGPTRRIYPYGRIFSCACVPSVGAGDGMVYKLSKGSEGVGCN